MFWRFWLFWRFWRFWCGRRSHVGLALQNPRTAAVRARVGMIIDVRIASRSSTFIVPGTPSHLCQVSVEKRDSGRVLIVHYRTLSAGVARLSTYNVPIGHIDNFPLMGKVTITREQP